MGFRYSKRYGDTNGWGLNVGSSGISSSYWGKYGTIGSRGFSITTAVQVSISLFYQWKQADYGNK